MDYPRVSREAAEAYRSATNSMLRKVNSSMTAQLQRTDLIGENTLNVMFDNHDNHARFLYTCMVLHDEKMVRETLDWVLDSYQARDFSSEYFPAVLQVWQQAVKTYIPEALQSEILDLYRWMAAYVETSTRKPSPAVDPAAISGEDPLDGLIELLISGKRKAAELMIDTMQKDYVSLQAFYLKVLRSAMYRIGLLWQNNQISTAHEHLASSIVLSAISRIYNQLPGTDTRKGSLVVTSAVNEYHEIGARMITDLLEIEGWEVSFLGANTPTEDLLKLLKEVSPDAVCISVTMSFNLPAVLETIACIRSDEQLSRIPILVGGYALSFVELREQIPADLVTTLVSELITFLETLEVPHG